MMLVDLVEFLEGLPQKSTIHFGFGKPNSYRGDYSEVAFEFKENALVEDMLLHAKSAIGQTFQGYKGGNFTMEPHTDAWIANWGDYPGQSIGETVCGYWKRDTES